MTASAAIQELVISRVFNARLWSAPSRDHTAGASARRGRRYHARHAVLLLGVDPRGQREAPRDRTESGRAVRRRGGLVRGRRRCGPFGGDVGGGLAAVVFRRALRAPPLVPAAALSCAGGMLTRQ